jgi:hypothetical protein
MTHDDTEPKVTFAIADDAEIRCSSRLRCDCGARLKALDVWVKEFDDRNGIKHVKAICPRCHGDWFEVAL